jgi:hypothetical protein
MNAKPVNFYTFFTRRTIDCFGLFLSDTFCILEVL